MDLNCVLLSVFWFLEENQINNKINTNEKVIFDQMPEFPQPDNPALSYKKNLVRLLVLSGLGFITLALLGVSFFFVFIKL